MRGLDLLKRGGCTFFPYALILTEENLFNLHSVKYFKGTINFAGAKFCKFNSCNTLFLASLTEKPFEKVRKWTYFKEICRIYVAVREFFSKKGGGDMGNLH